MATPSSPSSGSFQSFGQLSEGSRTVPGSNSRGKPRNNDMESSSAAAKRRCVSTACIACRKRKSKCDGNTPSCAACASVYGTECVYDPNSDHRRKGVYKRDIHNLKTKNSTLQTLIQAILNFPEHEVPELVRQIRTCESLDDVAESLLVKEHALNDQLGDPDQSPRSDDSSADYVTFESQLSQKMGELRLENGSVRFFGGTSNLLHSADFDGDESALHTPDGEQFPDGQDSITSWSNVSSDKELIIHLINMYFTWHYAYFTTLSRSLFYRDFLKGKPSGDVRTKSEYCTPLLVNAMLALGCHFTSWPGARADPEDSATAGDHFFKEAKRLLMEDDELETPKLPTVQALALMSVREAGCGREAKGWVYSGMSFRMACDLGLNLDSGGISANKNSSLDPAEEDARRITFWGCFLFDKCWSNYLGRQPQLVASAITVPHFEVFPDEDAAIWSPYTDSGPIAAHAQPSRTRAVALQISYLCEISSDIINFFYHPSRLEKPPGKQAELKKLSEVHTRLEAWRKNLPKEMEPREGALSSVLVMHMFFQLLFIHMFRPFLKYNQATSPLPANVSPRKLCTQAATMISKIMRLYKRTYGLRQICNIAIYILHAACTIHMLNLPERNASRDITYGLKHAEEMAEGWLCARKTLSILDLLVKKWNIELPEEASTVLQRAAGRFGFRQSGTGSTHQSPSIKNSPVSTATPATISEQQSLAVPQGTWQDSYFQSYPSGFYQGSAASTAYASAVGTPETYQHATLSLPPQSAAELQTLNNHRRYSANAAANPHQDHKHWMGAGATNTGATRKRQASPGTTPAQSGQTTQSNNSPTLLFHDAGAIAEDSQEWLLREHSALAMGFGNWTGAGATSGAEMDPPLFGNESTGVFDQSHSTGGNTQQGWYF
ncbi:hypothetical protein L228DRAFT_260161 [Xylona heveae TC161]|uniref:Zn(2)-C6 fungal-type domain-containing protein n=1 Tax=Xylona heveae (strain CBS 132557 / TC161) TaxID=1328760 RepID=A0A165HCW1_XYLHT|nr:hypothetical protein L228DRAFT_260161 [Xylona heveae TC161]KZF23318.1 hypothetical protein L228DRAFT_260161 [Xylona heveae TC161]